MIKIINDTHFAFLNHELETVRDSSNHFDEFLDFYKDKNWEGKTLNFKVSIQNDTLIQTGVEK
ncbi:hypothetical protein [Pedobacter africanus]|nr:hypothetical protein [Pedobacter africanus]